MKKLWSVLVVFVLVGCGAMPVDQDRPQYRATFVPEMVSDSALCPDANLVTNNKDVYGLVTLLDRQMLELATSASARIPEIIPLDRRRIDGYIYELIQYHEQIDTTYLEDYAGTQALYYCLRPPSIGPLVTGQAINDLLIRWTLMKGELLTSASSLLPSDLRPPDSQRLTDHIDGIRLYLQHLDGVPVGDYPRQGPVTRVLTEPDG